MVKNKLRKVKRKICSWLAFIQFIRTEDFRSASHDSRERLFIMINALSGGGAQRVASIVAAGLREYYSVTVITLRPAEESFPLDDAVKVIRLPQERLKRQDIQRCISWLKRHRKPVAVISFMHDCNTLNVSSPGPGKVICSERNNPQKKAPGLLEETEKVYRKADHVIFQSSTVRDLYPEEIRARSTILPNPVSISCVASDVPGNRIVTAGRLHEQKNQALLIKAFAAFHAEHPEYELSIYGEGALRGELGTLAAELGMAQAVHLHGNVKDLHSRIADARMFVLSSDYEGLSNALLEAMMMGLPCISTACEGSTDVIEDGVNGLLVPVGDGDALQCAMCRLAEDDALRGSIARAAGETGRAFRAENVIAMWQEMIEKVAAE